MEIEIVRDYFTSEITMGKLYFDHAYFCDTLEDAYRKPGEKIFGKTAIPTGYYKMIIDYSPKFQRYLPHILNVPNFKGIRIHNGNTHFDTAGCILIGRKYNNKSLKDSTTTLGYFMEKISDYSIVYIQIINK